MALVNAKVWTMNPSQPLAQAVAISKNSIVKVGTNQEIYKLIGTGTKVISLDGKTVVPGLIDTHIHVADFGRCLMWLDLSGAESIKDLQTLLKEKAKKTPSGKWIVGRGWNENNFKEKRLLTLGDLDAAAPDNPVILYHGAAYTCAANTSALALAGVTSKTASPLGGTIDKTVAGELTGVFRDSATNLIWQAVAEPTLEELTDATALACQHIVQAGITSIDWIILSENELSLIQTLQAKGKLPVRVNVIVPYELLSCASGFTSTDPLKLRLGGAIIFADGYLDSKTAALMQPYSDDPTNSGKMMCTQQELATWVGQVLALGLQPTIHAMGDRAIDRALNVIEQSGKKVRFRIEQAAILNRELVKRLKTQDIVVSVQPKMVPTEFTVWSATEHLGAERAKWLHPLKTLLDEGIRVAGGSDCPMEPLSPLLGMQEAVVRESYPEQRLTVEEALRMYTLDAAYCSGEENIKGSIEEGKLADLTVLSSDPWLVPPSEIEEINVELTVIGGQIFFSKP
ncbi:MAG: amidohydrolase [Chloroflexi bacterium]|nr:amidohydrolase [Chloroflexota bacterium]